VADDEALQVAADRAAVLRTWSYEELTTRLLGKCESTELLAASGTAYVIEASAQQEGDDRLRVVVSVVRGPTESFVVAPDGTFVTEG
jgi:hypothetical protein